ncbi:MAG: hypothetical protein ABSA03_08690 [Streptosporangiaceae bacterium]
MAWLLSEPAVAGAREDSIYFNADKNIYVGAGQAERRPVDPILQIARKCLMRPSGRPGPTTSSPATWPRW